MKIYKFLFTATVLVGAFAVGLSLTGWHEESPSVTVAPSRAAHTRAAQSEPSAAAVESWANGRSGHREWTPSDRFEPEVAAALAADPIAREVPHLLGRTEEHQLRTLRWMRDAPGSKLVSAFPELAADGRPMVERLADAHAKADRLIGLLEARIEG